LGGKGLEGGVTSDGNTVGFGCWGQTAKSLLTKNAERKKGVAGLLSGGKRETGGVATIAKEESRPIRPGPYLSSEVPASRAFEAGRRVEGGGQGD